jgi:hypothetical protein
MSRDMELAFDFMDRGVVSVRALINPPIIQ